MNRLTNSIGICVLVPFLMAGCLGTAIDLYPSPTANFLTNLLAQPLDVYGWPCACQELRDPGLCVGHYLLGDGEFPPREPSDLSCRDADLGIAAELFRILESPQGDQPISLANAALRVQEDADVLLASPGSKPSQAILDARAAKFVAQPRFLLLLAAFCTPDPADFATLRPVLLQGLNDNFAETRELAAIGLGKFGRHAIPAVEDVRRAAARDCDSLVRCYAAYALWQIDGRPEPSARFLANELGNKAGPCVPELAALLLGRMGPDALDALPSLCKLLDDKSPSIRAQAVFALGKIGPGAVSAVPLLCNSLRDSADAQQLLSEESNLSVRDLEYQGDIPRISFRIVRKAPWELLRGTLRYRSVRSFAAIALGRIGCADGTVIAALKTLKSESLIGTKDHQAADEALSILAP